MKITTRAITDHELDEMYGNHLRHKIDSCFKTNDDHYFMQKNDNVLHVNYGSLLINTLHNSFFDDVDQDRNLTKIDMEEFLEKLRETIFNLGIYEYTKSDK